MWHPGLWLWSEPSLMATWVRIGLFFSSHITVSFLLGENSVFAGHSKHRVVWCPAEFLCHPLVQIFPLALTNLGQDTAECSPRVNCYYLLSQAWSLFLTLTLHSAGQKGKENEKGTRGINEARGAEQCFEHNLGLWGSGRLFLLRRG